MYDFSGEFAFTIGLPVSGYANPRINGATCVGDAGSKKGLFKPLFSND